MKMACCLFLRVFLVFWVVLAVLAPALGEAATLFPPTGDPNAPVVVFKNEKLMQEGVKYLASGGSIFNYKVFGRYVRAIPDGGTDCLVLKSKLGKRKIRILSGPHAGKVGWVPSEMIRE